MLLIPYRYPTLENIIEFSETLKKRFKEILEKNVDIDFFFNFDSLTCSSDEKCYKYAPLTTVETERSFSKHKEILSDNRKKFTSENLKKTSIFIL